MLTVELLIFDLDGTLCDTKDDIAQAVNLTFRELGLPEKSPQDIYGYVGGGVRRLLQQALGVSPSTGFSPAQGQAEKDEAVMYFDKTMRIFRKHYMEHLLDTTKPYPGIEMVLNHFQHKKKAVATNKPQIYTDRIMKGLGLESHFDLVVGSDNGFALKPEPDMLLFVLEKLQVQKSQCVMIGDGLHDIKASREAGIRICAVGYGLTGRQELKEAGPDFFCEQPEELTWLFG